MNKELDLEKAIAARDAFLEKHPDLKPYQKEIDRRLNATPADQRMEVVSIMMVERLGGLQKKIAELALAKKQN